MAWGGESEGEPGALALCARLANRSFHRPRPWQAQSGGESFAARVLTVAAVNDIINIDLCYLRIYDSYKNIDKHI